MPKPLIIWTYDWVPGGKGSPRGHVRDIRLRWACEEAGIAYEVRTVPFDERGPEHFARQPFGQVPFLEDDGIVIFESGAALLHLAGMADVLRIPKVRGFGTFPALGAYVERACARPAFRKAKDDQMAHFAAADTCRAEVPMK